jgi:hypothetical protein
MLKVAYVGQLWVGSTSLERLKALRSLEWDLTGFDTTPYLAATGRFMRAMQHRLLIGPDVQRLNSDLIEFANRAEPFDVLWVDKGRWIYPTTLAHIQATSGARLIHYTPDPAFTLHTSRHFERSLAIYDLCITTKRYELQQYAQRGAKQVLFTLQGIDNRFVQSATSARVDGIQRSGIVFIGHAEEHYKKVLTDVGRKHRDLKIWGPGWERHAGTQDDLRSFVKGGPLWGEDYVRGLASGKIGIGLLSKYYPDQFTTRTFEIPAAGTMLIAERTAEHTALFDEDKEAAFFSSTEELNDKIGFYLSNEPARLKIAALGRKRTLSSYHWTSVLASAVRGIEDMRSRK